MRFTYSMRTLIEYAAKMHPHPADVGGGFMRTARSLERGGFLTVEGRRKNYRVRLTQAGGAQCRQGT
jgi:hypothetical protein